MKLNNKGFAISSVIYMSLVLFLVLIMSLLTVLASRKNILDKNRKDVYNYINNIIDNSEKQEDLNMEIPKLSSNMIPIIYNPSGFPVKADINLNSKGVPRNWYNYAGKKWANAVLVKDTARTNYINALPGEEINESDILAYLVWIPRYKYSVNTADKTINIVFEKSTTTKSNGTATNTSYLTHPSFTFNSKELSGIWVAKYVASGVGVASGSTSATGIKFNPGVEPLLDLNIEEMFYNTRMMEATTNIYGFEQTSTSFPKKNTGGIDNDSNTIDTHLIKNTEWGAIALLSQSKYGINRKVQNYNFNSNKLTGGGVISSVVSNGKQSTTGNIYGIFDMVSDIGESVMGFVYSVDSSILPMYFNSYNPTNALGIKGDATNNDNLDISSSSGYTSEGFLYRGKEELYQYNVYDGINEEKGFRLSLVIW